MTLGDATAQRCRYPVQMQRKNLVESNSGTQFILFFLSTDDRKILQSLYT